jgi:hypothetical protein
MLNTNDEDEKTRASRLYGRLCDLREARENGRFDEVSGSSLDSVVDFDAPVIIRDGEWLMTRNMLEGVVAGETYWDQQSPPCLADPIYFPCLHLRGAHGNLKTGPMCCQCGVSLR